MRRLVSIASLAVAALLLAACSTPLLLSTEVRIDAITPATGSEGTQVELAGLFTGDATIEVCGEPIADVSFAGSDRAVVAPGIAASGPGYTLATGTIATVPDGTTCDVVALVGGEPVGEATVTFTTDPSSEEPDPDPDPEPEEPVIDGISVFPATENLVVGSFTQFRATRIDTEESVTADVTWSSSDPSVATVSNDPGSEGLVTAVAPGEVTIRAESALGNGTGVVTVVAGMIETSGVVVSDADDASIGASATSRNIAVDRDLTVHVAWIDQDDGTVRYSRSTDYGASFEASLEIFPGASVTGTPVVSVATSGADRAYVAIVDGSGQLRLARSSDSGETWTTADVVASAVNPMQFSIATFEEHVYVAVRTGSTDLLRSSDHGATFDTIADVLPSMAYWDVLVDSRTGEVFVIGDTPTIHYARSSDGGATFTPYETGDSGYEVYYSDYSISQLGDIIIAGASGAETATIWNFDDDTWARASSGENAVPEHASAAIDGANRIHIQNGLDTTGNGTIDTIRLSTSSDGGQTYSSVDVASGSEHDIAPSTFVVGAPVIYNDGGVIKYSFVANPE